MLRARAFRRLVPHCGPGEHCLELVRSQVVDVQVGEVKAPNIEDRPFFDLSPVDSIKAFVGFQGVENSHATNNPRVRTSKMRYFFQAFLIVA